VIALPGTGLIGIATSKKIGTKPQRNRAKRRFREAIRQQPQILNPRLDIVVVVTEAGSGATFDRIREEVKALFGKAIERWAEELESF